MDPVLIGVIVILSQGLIEITKRLLPSSKQGFRESDRLMLTNLHDQHDKYDSDGTPLWYVPRSWQDTQKLIVEQLRAIGVSQQRTVEMLSRLEAKIGDNASDSRLP